VKCIAVHDLGNVSCVRRFVGGAVQQHSSCRNISFIVW